MTKLCFMKNDFLIEKRTEKVRQVWQIKYYRKSVTEKSVTEKVSLKKCYRKSFAEKVLQKNHCWSRDSLFKSKKSLSDHKSNAKTLLRNYFVLYLNLWRYFNVLEIKVWKAKCVKLPEGYLNLSINLSQKYLSIKWGLLNLKYLSIISIYVYICLCSI